MAVTESIREMILARASSQQIKQKAIAAGMRTLRQDGLQKVLRGLYISLKGFCGLRFYGIYEFGHCF
jgi:type II secretory ATPase GspE/PulE/Tfp pilus assembly ATPase PilB-like protein